MVSLFHSDESCDNADGSGLETRLSGNCGYTQANDAQAEDLIDRNSGSRVGNPLFPLVLVFGG